MIPSTNTPMINPLRSIFEEKNSFNGSINTKQALAPKAKNNSMRTRYVCGRVTRILSFCFGHLIQDTLRYTGSSLSTDVQD